MADDAPKGEAEIEADNGPKEEAEAQAQPPPEELEAQNSNPNLDLESKLQYHMLKSSCTHWNEESKKYETVSVKSKPKHLGEVTASVGIELYFRLVKDIFWLFLFMFILSCPMLILNCAGSMLESNNPVNGILGKASIANIGRCPPAGCRTAEDYEDRCVFFGDCGDGLKVRDVSQWLGLLDGLALISFVAFGVYFGDIKLRKIVRKFDLNSITPGDYTMCVNILPNKLAGQDHREYQDRLQKHFVKVLQSILKPTDASSEDAPTNDYSDAVYRVTLVRKYNGQVADFMSQGKLLLERENAEELKRKYTEAGQESKVAKQQRAIEKLTGKIDAFNDKFAREAEKEDEDRSVCRAYVTFKKIDYMQIVLSEYRFARFWLFRLCQSQELRFEGQPICVKQAEEPSDLYWENLDFDPYWRLARKAGVLALTFLLLMLCTGILVSIKSATKITPENTFSTWIIQHEPDESTDACLKVCSWSMFEKGSCSGDNSNHWNVSQHFNSIGDIDLAPGWPGTAESCDPIWESPGCNLNGTSKDWLGVAFEDPHEVGCMQLIQDAANPVEKIRVYGCPSDAVPAPENRTSWTPAASCVPMQVVPPATAVVSGETGIRSGRLKIIKDTFCDAEVTLEVADQAKAAGDDVTVNCFCTKELSRDANLIRPPFESPEQKVCEEWSKNQAMTYGMMALGVIGVCILNQVLVAVFAVFIKWEKPQTVSEYTQSQLFKLFLAQFANTGLLTYLVNARFEKIPAPLLIITEPLSIGKGAYYEANGSWFEAVGAALLITILSQVFTSTLTPAFIAKCVAPVRRNVELFMGSKVTYATLRPMYTLPEWNLALRLAQTMNVICCVIFYAGGMPLMYVIGMMYCVFAYWLDKFTLLRGSKRPPAYSEAVLELSMHFFPIAVLLHAIFAGFVLGNPALLPSHWSMLQGLGEAFLGLTETQYDEIRTAWEVGSSEERTEMYHDFFRTRLLDFARESAWLLMLIFLATLAYYVLYYLYWLLLAPVLSPVVALIQECFMKCGFCQAKKPAQSGCTYEEALARIKKQGMPKNYDMRSNEKYRAAAEAISHIAARASLVQNAVGEAQESEDAAAKAPAEAEGTGAPAEAEGIEAPAQAEGTEAPAEAEGTDANRSQL